MTVHIFSSTGEAYDACQCDEDVKNGDVLVIAENEGPIIGIAGTWPFAVTKFHGHLHTVSETEAGRKDNEDWWHRHVSPAQIVELFQTLQQHKITLDDLCPAFASESFQSFLGSTYGTNLTHPPYSEAPKQCEHPNCPDAAEHKLTETREGGGRYARGYCKAHATMWVLDHLAEGVGPLTIEWIEDNGADD